jgi:nucleotide-binding universal stress UspA family protein
VAGAVARAASREGAGFVVAEPRYVEGNRWVGHGLVDWEVARACPVPVLLVRRATPYDRPRIVAAVDTSRNGERGASLDRDVVRIAATWAERMEGSVSLVHCLREDRLAQAFRLSSLHGRRQRAASILAHLANGAGRSRPDVRVIDGPPVAGLLDAVAAEGADLVVLGTAKRPTLVRWLLGSTSEQLIRLAPCDLLLVQPRTLRRGLGVQAPRCQSGYPVVPFVGQVPNERGVRAHASGESPGGDARLLDREDPGHDPR